MKKCHIISTSYNIVGGAGIVGCGYYMAFLHKSPLSGETAEKEAKDIDIAEEY